MTYYNSLVQIIWKLESNWSTALATSLLGPTVILDEAKLAVHAGVVLNFPAFEKFLPGHVYHLHVTRYIGSYGDQ